MNLPSLDSAFSELNKAEALLKSQLAQVQAAKRALLGSLASGGDTRVKTKAVPQKPVKGRKRAPAGSLKVAIKEALTDKANMTKKEIKEAIKAKGYKWSLDDMYLSKCLTELKSSKEIVSHEKDNRFEYALT